MSLYYFYNRKSEWWYKMFVFALVGFECKHLEDLQGAGDGDWGSHLGPGSRCRLAPDGRGVEVSRGPHFFLREGTKPLCSWYVSRRLSMTMAPFRCGGDFWPGWAVDNVQFSPVASTPLPSSVEYSWWPVSTSRCSGRSEKLDWVQLWYRKLTEWEIMLGGENREPGGKWGHAWEVGVAP